MSPASWWEDAAQRPEEFLDAKSVAALVEGALTTDPEEREAAAGALSRVVKALEDYPVEEAERAVVRSLPNLARGLADPSYYYSGQMISIMRRMNPDLPTVKALLDIIPVTPSKHRALLVEALGLCQAEAWSERVEGTLSDLLADPETQRAAAYALYCRARLVRRPETVRSLGTAVLDAPRSESQHLSSESLKYLIGALVQLLAGALETLATTELERIGTTRPDLCGEIAKFRGWLTRS